MSIEIIKVYKEHMPSLRFIGKCYTNVDKDGFGHKWNEWFQKGWFDELKKLDTPNDIENGCIGLMGCSEEESSFQYWIGMFFSQDTPVPDGYDYVDIPEGDIGTCWIYGKEKSGEIYGEIPHNMCMEKLKENGMGNCRDNFHGNSQKWYWFFERYNCPRFTTPDEKGNIILDYSMYII